MQDSLKLKTTLDELFSTCDNVFIVAHNRPDFDALGALVGMSLICKKNKKENYIIVDDDYSKLDSEVQKVLSSIKENFTIIKANDAPVLMNKDSALICVDVNKDYLVAENVKEILPIFKKIIVIDHHKPDDKTIKTPFLFIDDKLSSTCEEISRLLFSYGVKLAPDHANLLLAGIILDTNKFTKNASQETFSVVTKLTSRGANATIANNMFLEDYESDRKMLRIVNNSSFQTYSYGIACDDEENIRYSIEDIAKAADYLLKYQINASFAFGYIDDDTISISARSKGTIDVASIMKLFGGGGNEYSAAAKVKGSTLKEVKEKLSLILNPTTILSTVKSEENESQMRLVLGNCKNS